MDRNDSNRPGFLRLPIWHPDGYARRMAVRNFLFAQPLHAALTGVGVRPAPKGSGTEGTKTNAYMEQRQQFTSAVGRVADPTIKNVPTTGQYPDTSAPGMPSWAVEWSRHQWEGRS